MVLISVPWLLVGITSIANLFGSLMIGVDLIWNRFSKSKVSILESETFLGLSLSLSSGTLLITSLNALLPKSIEYIKHGSNSLDTKSIEGLGASVFFGGIIVCYTVNYIVIRYSSLSIAGCSHGMNKSVANDPERNPLLPDNRTDNGYSAVSPNLNACYSGENCSGGDSERSSVSRHLPNSSSKDARQLFSIGLQTTLGISIHRLPEGLLLFATSQTDRQLGLSIVLALTLHSFSEGFSISAPLYKALKNRSQVLAIAMVLGCGPQIFGAFLGSLLFHGDEDLSRASLFNFGVCMAATSGFMLVVCLQMISSALIYKSQQFVIRWILIGCLVSLFSRFI